MLVLCRGTSRVLEEVCDDARKRGTPHLGRFGKPFELRILQFNCLPALVLTKSTGSFYLAQTYPE